MADPRHVCGHARSGRPRRCQRRGLPPPPHRPRPSASQLPVAPRERRIAAGRELRVARRDRSTDMRRALWQRRKSALLLAVALIAGGLGALSYGQHLLRHAEQQTIDALFQIRGTNRRMIAGFVLVNIDATTPTFCENETPKVPWPQFPRRYYASVIDQLHRAGAKVIAFDVQFTGETD